MTREHPSKIWGRLRAGAEIDNAVAKAVDALCGTSDYDSASPGLLVEKVDDFTLDVVAHRLRLRSVYTHVVSQEEGGFTLLGALTFYQMSGGTLYGSPVYTLYVDDYVFASVNGDPRQRGACLRTDQIQRLAASRSDFREEIAYAIDAILLRV